MSNSSSPEPVDPMEELARMMSDNVEDSNILGGIPSSPSPSSVNSSSLQGSRTNATLHARRLANRLSLGPYSRELESFATEDPANRTLLLYAKLLVVEQKVSKISVSSGSFTVGKALSQDNIKNYTHAVLLSLKLGTYKGDITWKRVMAVIKHLNVNVPANLESDRHIYKAVKEAVTLELTQTRSKLKKARKVHAEKDRSGPKFWDYVDERLKLIRTVAEGSEEKIQQALATMLAQDRSIYGTKSQSTIQSDSSPNEWQTTVDDVISAAATTADGSAQNDEADGDDD
ncbi:hypothetical protein H1R20_g14408, partial [Candolleomyces eurysporus]